MGKYYIGFDCGTQSVKVAIYDADFELVDTEQTPTEIKYPNDGWAELDVNEYLNSVRTGIKICIERSEINPRDVRAICGDGIICGIVGIDKDGEAITPYIPYLDSKRCSEDTEWINNNLEPLWLNECGNPEIASWYPIAYMRWLLKNNEEFKKNGVKFVHNGPYVLSKLAGIKADDMFIDYATLSGSQIGYDIVKKEWSKKQLDSLEIPLELLPKIVNPWDTVGYLTEDEAELTGLVKGIPIIAGAGDTMQSLLGCGLIESGMASDVAGTAAMIAIVVDKPYEELNAMPGLCLSIGTLGDTYFYWGIVRAGGLSLRWFKDNVCNKATDNSFYDEIEKKVTKVNVGADGVIFIPYLQGGDGDLKSASGCFMNMSAKTDQGELYRAILESIAYEYKDVLDEIKEKNIPIKSIVVTEGGSKSNAWNQIKADVINTDVYTVKIKEGAVRSNVLLAAYAVGDIKDLKGTIKDMSQIKDYFKVNKNNSEKYKTLFDKRKKLINTELMGAFDTLSTMI